VSSRAALAAIAVALSIALSGCGSDAPASPRSVTLSADQAAVITFTGGRYRFTWDAGTCPDFAIRLDPTAGGDPIVVPVSAPQGTIEVDVPAVEARVERTGNCGGANHTVTIEKL
jgi:hypothetical protein